MFSQKYFTKNIITSLIVLAILSSACSQISNPAGTPPQGSTPTASTASQALVQPSATPIPSQTPEPSATSVPTETPTPTPLFSATPTITATVPSELNGAKFYTSGFLKGFKYFIAIQSANPVKGQYNMVVNESKDYTCLVIPRYPNRLYCSGALAAIDDWITYIVYDKTTSAQVYQGKIFIPLVIPP